jgi:hypothetical protein
VRVPGVATRSDLHQSGGAWVFRLGATRRWNHTWRPYARDKPVTGRRCAASWWRGFRDREGVHTSPDVDALCAALVRPRLSAGGKVDSPAWSPTRYREGAARGVGGVVALSCLVLDYDDGTAPEVGRAPWMQWRHVWHTSWSHTPEAPRWRLVVPLAVDVEAEHWPAVWAWAAGRAAGVVDRACKDPSRLWALHQARPDHAQGYHAGGLLDVSHLRVRPKIAPPVVGIVRRPALGLDARVESVHRARDPTWRAQAGRDAGAEVDDTRARHAPCPACGRRSVWWLLSPDTWGGAACEHRNSCGWTGKLVEVAGVG